MLHSELGPTAAIDGVLVDANQERRRVDEVPARLQHRMDVSSRAIGPQQMFEYLIGDDQIELPIEPVVTNIEIRVIGSHIFAKPECPPGRVRSARRYFENRKIAAERSDFVKQYGVHSGAGPLALVVSGVRVDGTDGPPYQIIRVRERILNLRGERHCLQTLIR